MEAITNPGLQFDAKGKVVATAPDGSFIVQRRRTIDVYPPSSTQSRSLPLGNPMDTPGFWYAVSSGGEQVAFVEPAGQIELWNAPSGQRLWRGDPGSRIGKRFEMPRTGPALEGATSWGAPAFVGQRLLVSHHQRGVVVWDIASGKAQYAVEDPSLTIARQSFVLDGQTIALRCGANSLGIANASLFVISLVQCKVINHLPLHRDGAVWAQQAGTALVTAGRSSIRITDPLQQLVLQRGREIEVLDVATAAGRIVWGSSDGRVQVWTRQTNRVASWVAGPKKGIVHVRDDGRNIHAIDSDGAVYAWPAPPAGEGELVEPMVIDGAERAWQDALVCIGLEDVAGAIMRMAPVIENPRASVKHRLAAVYVASIQSREDGEAFTQRCHSSAIDTRSDLVQSAMLALVDDLLHAENVQLALDMYMSWLKAPRHPKAALGDGIEVGLAVSHLLRSAEQNDLRSHLVRYMRRLFPRHEALKRELAELEAV